MESVTLSLLQEYEKSTTGLCLNKYQISRRRRYSSGVEVNVPSTKTCVFDSIGFPSESYSCYPELMSVILTNLLSGNAT